MRSQKFGEFNKGTKRNPRLANRHTHTSDRVKHPGRYDNDMTRRGFNPRHRTVSGSINAFASHPPPEERVVGVMHSHKLADMGRMTMRWPAGSTASLSANMLICLRTKWSMKPSPPTNTLSPKPVAASADDDKRPAIRSGRFLHAAL